MTATTQEATFTGPDRTLSIGSQVTIRVEKKTASADWTYTIRKEGTDITGSRLDAALAATAEEAEEIIYLSTFKSYRQGDCRQMIKTGLKHVDVPNAALHALLNKAHSMVDDTSLIPFSAWVSATEVPGKRGRNLLVSFTLLVVNPHANTTSLFVHRHHLWVGKSGKYDITHLDGELLFPIPNAPEVLDNKEPAPDGGI